MQVSVQFHAPTAFPPVKSPQYPLGGRLSRPQNRYRPYREEINFALVWNRTLAIELVIRRYTDWPSPTLQYKSKGSGTRKVLIKYEYVKSTYSVEYTASWEANSRAPTQEVALYGPLTCWKEPATCTYMFSWILSIRSSPMYVRYILILSNRHPAPTDWTKRTQRSGKSSEKMEWICEDGTGYIAQKWSEDKKEDCTYFTE
jgi:hypothetical protein